MYESIGTGRTKEQVLFFTYVYSLFSSLKLFMNDENLSKEISIFIDVPFIWSHERFSTRASYPWTGC